MTIDPLRLVGAFPIGDPAFMRARAAELRSQAERLGTLASSVESRVRAARFEGPGAERCRREAADAAGRGRSKAQRLHALADYLARAADRLEHTQNDWRRRLRKAEEEAAAALRRGHF